MLTQHQIDMLINATQPETATFECAIVRETCRRTEEVFGITPCLWQIKVALALLRRDRDVVCIAGTGSGKTITFWLPLLLRKEKIQIVVTALTEIGNQNVNELTRAGLRAISINTETDTDVNFKVCDTTFTSCNGLTYSLVFRQFTTAIMMLS